MPEIRDAWAVITGGAKRVGRSLALGLAREEIKIVVHYNNSRREAEETAGTISRAGGTAVTIQSDLSGPGGVEQLWRNLPAAPAFLINSAAAFPSSNARRSTLPEFTREFALNAYAPMALTRLFAQSAAAECVVNILDARINDYDKDHLTYHLSKRALFSFTRIQCVEYAPRIRVNGVAPGLILPPAGEDPHLFEKIKDSNLLQRVGAPEDVVNAVLFLLKNRFITGQIIYVDGGRHVRGAMYG